MSKTSAEQRIDQAEPQNRFSLLETIFSIEEAAEYLRISRAGFYRLIKSEKVRPIHVGDRTLVHGRELARYVDTLMKPAMSEAPTKTGKQMGAQISRDV